MKYVTHAELEAAIAGAARGIALGMREALGRAPNQVRTLEVATSLQKFVAPTGTRTLTGIASTDELDRQGDRVNPKGMVAKLPVPLLLQHAHDKPIGWVREARAQGNAIHVVAEVATGTRIADDAWEQLERGLISGFSIGFRGLESKPLPGGGLMFERWELFELSVVTVPANASARITSATGKSTGSIKLIQPGAKLIQPVKLIGGPR